MSDRDVKMDIHSDYELPGDEKSLDLDSFIKDKRLKEIRFMIKIFGYWVNSNVALNKLKEHLVLEHTLNELY